MVRSAFLWYSQVRHVLNELHANLSLSNTPHSIQQKDLSPLSWVICVEKMPLEFGDYLCAAYEPIARIWHKGNDTIRYRPIGIIDVHLPEIHAISLFTRTFTSWAFYSQSCQWTCCCEQQSAEHPQAHPLRSCWDSVERFRMREERKGERPDARRPPITPIWPSSPPLSCSLKRKVWHITFLKRKDK